MNTDRIIIKAEALAKEYRHEQASTVSAVQPITFSVAENEIVGIIGESGSGKSTLLRLIAGLEEPTSGTICLDHTPVNGKDRIKITCRLLQMVFQNAQASFNPRKKMKRSIEEHMALLCPPAGKDKQRRDIDRLLSKVGIDPALAERYPSEVSGGQCQRIAIARALAVQPKLLLCDEITSALDVTTGARILQLLKQLHREFGLTILFVSHDLALTASFCDRVLVMKNGALVEQGKTADVLNKPQHPYTQLLLESIPDF